MSRRTAQPRKPDYSRLDWSKLTDAALGDLKNAIGALQAIRYTGAAQNNRLFSNWSGSNNFKDVAKRVRISISFSKAMLIAKGKNPFGGSYIPMLSYWQAATDLRRKILANFIVKQFRKDFKKKFGQPIQPELGPPISHPPAASYQQLDLPGTLQTAKAIQGLNSADLEDFVNDYVVRYNSKDGFDGGKAHLGAIEQTQELVDRNKP